MEIFVFPTEFKHFFEAMSDEMNRHQPEKGDSWKTNKKITTNILDELLQKAVVEYYKTRDISQLVDAANFCAMIWWRKERWKRRD